MVSHEYFTYPLHCADQGSLKGQVSWNGTASDRHLHVMWHQGANAFVNPQISLPGSCWLMLWTTAFPCRTCSNVYPEHPYHGARKLLGHFRKELRIFFTRPLCWTMLRSKRGKKNTLIHMTGSWAHLYVAYFGWCAFHTHLYTNSFTMIPNGQYFCEGNESTA